MTKAGTLCRQQAHSPYVVRYPRPPGSFPPPEENTHNAWYVHTAITGAASGPLHGKRIAVQDNMMIAGVPMMNGCSILEGYVPEIDAMVVQRILDASGEIVGKALCRRVPPHLAAGYARVGI